MGQLSRFARMRILVEFNTVLQVRCKIPGSNRNENDCVRAHFPVRFMIVFCTDV